MALFTFRRVVCDGDFFLQDLLGELIVGVWVDVVHSFEDDFSYEG